MTPKEKAESLINQYMQCQQSTNYFEKLEFAKTCAIICVDEILYEIMHNKKVDWLKERVSGEEYVEYWKEVKKDIQLL